MSYRPEGFKNPYPTTSNKWLRLLGWGDIGAVYEDAADAMLAALRKTAAPRDQYDYTINPEFYDGSWVFIPDEEK